MPRSMKNEVQEGLSNVLRYISSGYGSLDMRKMLAETIFREASKDIGMFVSEVPDRLEMAPSDTPLG